MRKVESALTLSHVWCDSVHPCTKDVLPCLDPLEKQVESVLRDHNKKVRGVFESSVRIKFSANRESPSFMTSVVDILVRCHITCLMSSFRGEKKENEKNATSPFVPSVSSFDLRARRHDVYVDNVIPVVELDGKRKSSWLIDLLAHHDLERIREHNITPERVTKRLQIHERCP